MTSIVQVSPVAHVQRGLSVKWGVVNGMEIASEFASTEVELARKKILGVTDVSCFERFGVKGPQAAQWLADHELTIPGHPNSWVTSKSKSIVMRLGPGEFLIEDHFGGFASRDLATDTTRVAGVYKVPRADAAFILSGSAVLNLLSEVCSLDLRDGSLQASDVVMTQIAGVGATILRQELGGEQVYRIWCDGTYGPYMWDVLLEIAGELGGGAVGLSHY